MENGLYERIRKLCEERGITISKLESECGFSNSTIKKWQSISTPGVDKVIAVAKYFGVSTDYILGRTEIPTLVEEVIGDNDIISVQRARTKMSPTDRERMMQMLKIGFDYAFRDQDE